MTEITPGIYRLKLPIPMPEIAPADVNAYLVRGDRGFLLVDTGWKTPQTLELIEREMAALGAGLKDISQIVVTHVHPDHYGLAGSLKKRSGASLAMHEMEKDIIALRYINMATLLEQTGRWLAASGVPPADLASIRDATVGLEDLVTPIDPDITLHGGETITCGAFHFQVLWTPGHSSGHICLYEPAQKVLICGDHILPTITPNVGSHPQSIDNPLGRYLDSLKDLRQRDVRLVLPGHESPFTGLKERIDEITRHHAVRTQEITAAVKDAPKTAYDIARELTWSQPGGWSTMPLFHKRLAIAETLAHLERLAAEGRIGRLSKDGVISYRQN